MSETTETLAHLKANGACIVSLLPHVNKFDAFLIGHAHVIVQTIVAKSVLASLSGGSRVLVILAGCLVRLLR